jgi:hypothetical protein
MTLISITESVLQCPPFINCVLWVEETCRPYSYSVIYHSVTATVFLEPLKLQGLGNNDKVFFNYIPLKCQQAFISPTIIWEQEQLMKLMNIFSSAYYYFPSPG